MDYNISDQRDTRVLSETSEAAKSVEGWVLFATNIHEEAQEEDLYDSFAEYGDVTSIQVPLDRRTGYVKGYAVVQYAHENEAKKAMRALNGSDLFGRQIKVDWAFRRDPIDQQATEHKQALE